MKKHKKLQLRREKVTAISILSYMDRIDGDVYTKYIETKLFLYYLLIYEFFLSFQKLIFEEGGEIFNLWEKPPVDLYVKIYLFNITNADAFMEGRENLRVEEVGPYVYK